MLYLLPTLCIIAQLCALRLFIMHKGDFFHFLHKKEKILHFGFGKNDSFGLCPVHLFTCIMFLQANFYVF